MGALNAWIVSRIRGSMKVVFALAVIITCVAANGSMPTIAEREVDIIPEDEELIQAKADEMSLVQAESGFQNEVAKMGNDGQSTGILGVDVNTGAQQTVVINPMDAPGSDNQEPTEDITTSERSLQSTARMLTPRRSPRRILPSLSSTPSSMPMRRARDMASLMRSPTSNRKAPKRVCPTCTRSKQSWTTSVRT